MRKRETVPSMNLPIAGNNCLSSRIWKIPKWNVNNPITMRPVGLVGIELREKDRLGSIPVLFVHAGSEFPFLGRFPKP